MQQIPLQAVPNQEFSITLDDDLYDLTIKTMDNITCVSIVRNGIDIIDNIRCVPFAPVMPSRYEETGNFAFVTSNGELPYYTQFNVTQQLIYLSAAELVAARTPVPPPITAASFNPIAALPLRFAPQGYVAG
jgi:hypothetical protein